MSPYPDTDFRIVLKDNTEGRFPQWEVALQARFRQPGRRWTDHLVGRGPDLYTALAELGRLADRKRS